MVLLHHIVEVFALTQTNPTREDALSFQPFHSRRKGSVLVHIDDPWHRIAGRAQSLTEEAVGRGRIPLGGEQKIDLSPDTVRRGPRSILFCLPNSVASFFCCPSFVKFTGNI